jgi:hypothetical protein
VLVPSQAAGVKMGESISTNPRWSKKSRMAMQTSLRTLRMACGRLDRSQRCLLSIRKSMPWSLGEIGYSLAM